MGGLVSARSLGPFPRPWAVEVQGLVSQARVMGRFDPALVPWGPGPLARAPTSRWASSGGLGVMRKETGGGSEACAQTSSAG